jgi:hypothetical protein
MRRAPLSRADSLPQIPPWPRPTARAQSSFMKKKPLSSLYEDPAPVVKKKTSTGAQSISEESVFIFWRKYECMHA